MSRDHQEVNFPFSQFYREKTARFIFVNAQTVYKMPLLCGGTTEAKDANEEVQKICDEVGNFSLQINRNSEVMRHATANLQFAFFHR